MRLHWHRRDLRLIDNPALASDGDPVVGVVVLDDRLTSLAGEARLAFYREAIDRLRSAYRNRGGALLVRRGAPTTVLPRLADTLDVGVVSWEADYSGFSQRRDDRVRDRLESNGLRVHSADGAVSCPPGTITTADGDPYQVFTYYGRKWLAHEHDGPTPPPDAVAEPAIDPGNAHESLPHRGDIDASIPEAGPAAARERLETFCTGPIHAYAARRDEPAVAGTSRLSQDLSFGTIGVRTVLAATDAARTATDADVESIEAFERQLAWREFYTQVLWDRPDTVTEPFRKYPNPIEWRDDPDGVAAWKAGETGFPIVDAGMRQLRSEAWMHNRLRMIVASFLTKDLLVDWREGYRWFREHLVDHDTANDVGGWQWAASTGTDAQPYFRIFNPMTQGERHDPEARYITRYVPELDGVDPEEIHRWDELATDRRETLAPDYPGPIVDHADRREAAIATFEAARGDE